MCLLQRDIKNCNKKLGCKGGCHDDHCTATMFGQVVRYWYCPMRIENEQRAPIKSYICASYFFCLFQGLTHVSYISTQYRSYCESLTFSLVTLSLRSCVIVFCCNVHASLNLHSNTFTYCMWFGLFVLQYPCSHGFICFTQCIYQDTWLVHKTPTY